MTIIFTYKGFQFCQGIEIVLLFKSRQIYIYTNLASLPFHINIAENKKCLNIFLFLFVFLHGAVNEDVRRLWSHMGCSFWYENWECSLEFYYLCIWNGFYCFILIEFPWIKVISFGVWGINVRNMIMRLYKKLSIY